MRCLVTAGPTYEPLDDVRRLTNLSTGRLGSELANFLAVRGHAVTLLLGQQATWRSTPQAAEIEAFSTGADLREHLRAYASQPIHAVFHAAAVSDFTFGKVWLRTSAGELRELKSGKLSSTGEGTLLAELAPTPKILGELRTWFPKARLVGWKYEVDGDRTGAVRLAKQQINECRTDSCVANGPAYGEGFGLVTAKGARHLADSAALFSALEETLRSSASSTAAARS